MPWSCLLSIQPDNIITVNKVGFYYYYYNCFFVKSPFFVFSLEVDKPIHPFSSSSDLRNTDLGKPSNACRSAATSYKEPNDCTLYLCFCHLEMEKKKINFLCCFQGFSLVGYHLHLHIAKDSRYLAFPMSSNLSALLFWFPSENWWVS